MKYVSGIFALNIPCDLETCGDWHTPSLDWDNLDIKESSLNIFGSYGIEKNKEIVFLKNKYNVANHVRACLDLILYNKLSVAEGMNKDYICNEKYDNEIFKKILLMQDLPHWEDINKFMEKEYLMKWINFLKGRNLK